MTHDIPLDTPPVSIGLLSFRSHATTRNTLRLLRQSGVATWAEEFFVYFNGMTEDDEELARQEGVAYDGSAENTGIYGGFRAIAEHARSPYVLILENDIVPVPDVDVGACIKSCVADMTAHNIRAFCLRSRTELGQGGVFNKYLKCFDVKDPVTPHIAPQPLPVLARAQMLLKHGYVAKFRATSIYVEKHPERVQPRAVQKLPSGNYRTDSRFRNWSNQAVLVEKDFFLNVVCRRVETHPDPRLINGHQDIERALNSWWWRKRYEPLGHAAQGVFSHERLDRT